jgi:predicted O-methyltransferase YrrM
MIESPELYFKRLVPPRDPLLAELEAEAARERIPIVGPVVGELLGILARFGRAERILELGAATGYSAIHLGRALIPPRGRLITFESDPKMAVRAERNLRRAGLDSVVEVKVADADQGLSRIEAPVDMIFMDIDKEGYKPLLPHCRRLLRRGGLLIADNVGFQGSDPFNRAIGEDPAFSVVNFYGFLPFHSPEQDGLCLALKR